MKITAVPATSATRQAIEALLVSQKLPVEDLPASLENFWIVENVREVIGVAGLELYQPVGLLRSLAVSPVHRNLGLGNIHVPDAIKQSPEFSHVCPVSAAVMQKRITA